MSATQRWSVAVAAALAFSAPVSAQQKAPVPASPVPFESATFVTGPATFFAPWSESARLSLDATEVTFGAPVMPDQARESQNENVAMMIVGGAALVVGSVIDGDAGTIIMVGGGVVGLIGLYRYLR